MIKNIFEEERIKMTNKITFTRDNIVIDRDIYYEDDYICAYIQVWFDAEAKFNIKLEDDEYVNVYALYYPDKDVFEVRSHIWLYWGG